VFIFLRSSKGVRFSPGDRKSSKFTSFTLSTFDETRLGTSMHATGHGSLVSGCFFVMDGWPCLRVCLRWLAVVEWWFPIRKYLVSFETVRVRSKAKFIPLKKKEFRIGGPFNSRRIDEPPPSRDRPVLGGGLRVGVGSARPGRDPAATLAPSEGRMFPSPGTGPAGSVRVSLTQRPVS
jgi:hypothetical protein